MATARVNGLFGPIGAISGRYLAWLVGFVNLNAFMRFMDPPPYFGYHFAISFMSFLLLQTLHIESMRFLGAMPGRWGRLFAIVRSARGSHHGGVVIAETTARWWKDAHLSGIVFRLSLSRFSETLE